MAIRYNMTTGQGTYADGTPFEMGDIQHGMSKPVAFEYKPGLHPEADARLAAATTGGPIRGQSVRGAWIDEAADPGEAREAIAAASPRAPSVAARVEPQAGETWEEDGWRYALVRPDPCGFAAVATAPNGVKSAVSVSIEALARCKRVVPVGAEPAELRLVPNENGVGSRLVPAVTPFDGVMLGQLTLPRARVISSDVKGFEIQGIGDGVEVVRFWNKSANGKPLEMIWHGVPATVVIQSVTDQGRGEFTVSVRRWVEPLPAATWGGVPVPFERVDTVRVAAPAKPAALAAGQVWERTVGHGTKQRRTFVRPDERIGGRWFCEEHPNDWIDAWCMLTMDEWHYLGTREEIAAAERAARVTASSERMVAKARERANNEVREEAARLGVPYPGNAFLDAVRGLSADTTFAPPTPASPYREAPAREPEQLNQATGAFLDVISRGWFNVERDAGETDEALRARCRLFGADGCDFVAPTLTLDAANSRRADLGLRPLGAGEAGMPSPLAALRATIDALIAADHGPFAHARAAALRAWGEQARPTGLPFTDPAQRLADLRTYEEMRGGGAHPTIRARDFAADQIGTGTVATYERERARSDVYARPRR